MVGEGSMIVLSNKRGLLAQMNAKSVLRTYVSYPLSETWSTDTATGFPSLLREGSSHLRTFLAAQFPCWSPNLLSLITNADDDPIRAWPIYTLPLGLRWSTQPGVILLGDAAHVTAPGGEGVNLAMLDAVKLAEEIVGVVEGGRWKEEMVEALRRYEGPMLDRAEKGGRKAMGMQEMMFGEDAPKGFLEFMRMAMEGQAALKNRGKPMMQCKGPQERRNFPSQKESSCALSRVNLVRIVVMIYLMRTRSIVLQNRVSFHDAALTSHFPIDYKQHLPIETLVVLPRLQL
ncbi:hypothetical protein HDV00_010063 [Rhizophlyctis rosea]|nr:hypothetical protein HDV00_010063 [Rhizophlyctis rosea]